MTDKQRLTDKYPHFREYYVASKKEAKVRKRWTADEDVRLYELMSAGVSYAKIGEEMGRTEKSVEMRAFTLRRKMRAAGMKGQQDVMTKRKPRKRKQTKRKASVKRAPKKKAPPAKPEPEIVYSGGAMFEERMGRMMMLGAVGAAGVWLVLILLIVGFLQAT
jgi:hypothetical protein|tara:strand:- start:1668 stop:2153 length:486 start_codon:yes stop_codon:yes gene_type:complete